MTPDAFEVWRRRREVDGEKVTLIDLYRLVAEPRGLAPHELPLEERAALTKRAMPVMWPGFEVAPGSDRGPEPIEIVPYDSAWAKQFDVWRDRLAAALGDTARRIEHVGSTAIPGLAAKPVIDIGIGVINPELEESYVPAIENIGIQLRSRDDLHRFFRPFAGRPRDVQVHVSEFGGGFELRHLLFRDYLRSNDTVRDAYLEAKLEAARVWRDDRLAYADAKTEVIAPLMRQAEAWAAGLGWQP